MTQSFYKLKPGKANPKAELDAALKASILQLEIEIAKADLMANDAEEEGELPTAAEERARRLRLDLEESRKNLGAAQRTGEKAK